MDGTMLLCIIIQYNICYKIINCASSLFVCIRREIWLEYLSSREAQWAATSAQNINTAHNE